MRKFLFSFLSVWRIIVLEPGGWRPHWWQVWSPQRTSSRERHWRKKISEHKYVKQVLVENGNQDPSAWCSPLCTVPEFNDLVFVKTSPKRSFSVIENERFGPVFTKTGPINSGTGNFCGVNSRREKRRWEKARWEEERGKKILYTDPINKKWWVFLI